MSEPVDVSRRDFSKQTLGSLLTLTLLETLSATDAFADKVKPITTKWLSGVNDLSRQLRRQDLKQQEWQTQIEKLFKQVNLPELLNLVDFEKLTKNAKLVDNGARSLRFKFPKVEGLPKNFVFGKQIFALKKGRSVVPHGHNNMATAFLILKGDLHGRHYDRLKDEKSHFIIKPTIDRKFKPAEYSTVSDYKDNIHWFKADSDLAYIFNIHVLNVRPKTKLPTGRVYVDPDGEKLKDGLIRAKRMGYKDAHKKYG